MRVVMNMTLAFMRMRHRSISSCMVPRRHAAITFTIFVPRHPRNTAWENERTHTMGRLERSSRPRDQHLL